MPPFSGKKKKEQLKAKRAKKREENERQQEQERMQEEEESWSNHNINEREMCNYLEDANYNEHSNAFTQQENTKNKANTLMTYGADRKGIRSVFKRENNEELQWNKKMSYEPLRHRHFMDAHGIPFESWFAMPEVSERECESMNTCKRLIDLLPLAIELPKRGWNVNSSLYHNALQDNPKYGNDDYNNNNENTDRCIKSVNEVYEYGNVVPIKKVMGTTTMTAEGASAEMQVADDVASECNNQDSSIDTIELRHFAEYLKRLDAFSFVNMPPSFTEMTHPMCTRATHNFSSFERNIDVWRQLWRAVELADVVVLVTDARYPIIHIHLGLLEYIVKENKKPCVIVFNKIDLVPYQMLQKWKCFLRTYLESVGLWVMDADVDENKNITNKTENKLSTCNEKSEQAVSADHVDTTRKISQEDAVQDDEVNFTKSSDDNNKYLNNNCAPIVFRTFTADPRPEVQHGSRENNKNMTSEEIVDGNNKMNKTNSQNKTSLFNDVVDVTRRRRKREQRRGKMYEQLRSGAINVSRQMTIESDERKANHKHICNEGNAVDISTHNDNDSDNSSCNVSTDDDDDDTNNYGAHENFKGKDKAAHDLASDKRSYDELKVVAESINLLLAECKKLGSCYHRNSRYNYRSWSTSSSDNKQENEREQRYQAVAKCNQLREQEEQENSKSVPEEKQISQESNRQERTIHIAFVGFPNVGKSSLLNCITGTKVVSVSATPGHTKHVQTIPIESEGVVLIDSPGLAFPLLNVPRPLQAVIGTHQIAQTRAPQSGIAYLASHLPLEKIYGLRRPQGAVDNEEWSAYDICEAYASKRGYFVKHGKGALDVHRAAIALLQEAYEGRLVLYFAAPPQTLCFTKEYTEEVKQNLVLRVFPKQEEHVQKQQQEQQQQEE